MRVLIFVLSAIMTMSSAQAADPVAGKQKALLVCSDCHRTNGISVVENFPNLAGQKEMYLAKQLTILRPISQSYPAANPNTDSDLN